MYSAAFEYTLTWRDLRLRTYPCIDLLPLLLSRDSLPGELGGVADEGRTNFWVADVRVLNGIDGANAEYGTSTVEVSNVTGGASTPGTSSSAMLASRHLRSAAAPPHSLRASATRKQKLVQAFNFVDFPFDGQVLTFDLEVASSNLSCALIVAQLEVQELLPVNSPWRHNGQITAAHLGGQTSRCLVRVPIRRISTVFVVSQLVPLMLIGMAAMLVLQFNPAIPALNGARFSAQIFAMVLVSLRSNSNLGIGTPTYLIWSDYLRIGQFTLHVLALIETTVVHQLFRRNLAERALRIDRIGRAVLPFGMYPLFIISMLLIGNGHTVGGLLLFFFGLLALFLGSWAFLLHKSSTIARARRKLVAKIGSRDLTREENTHLLEEAFELFDDDRSGAIEVHHAWLSSVGLGGLGGLGGGLVGSGREGRAGERAS